MTTALVVIGAMVAVAVGFALLVAAAQSALIGHFTAQDDFNRARWVRANVGSGYTKEEAEQAERIAKLRARLAREDG